MAKKHLIGMVPLLAVGALAVMPVVAQAAPPELGRCVKGVAGGAKYKDPGCEKKSTIKGAYEWLPGPGPLNKFKSTLSSTKFQTTGTLDLDCSGGSDEGEYTGPKTDLETITFTGCTSRGPCQNAASGEIKTKPLTSELGFIKAPNQVGVSLEGPGGIFAEFECRGFKATISGSVIARITPISQMALGFKEVFKGSVFQKPENFEGQPKDTLLCPEPKDFGAPIEQCGLTTKDAVANEEPLDINEVL